MILPTAISEQTLAEMYYYAEFSAAAYCDPDHVPGTELTCKGNICPQVTANSVTTIIEFAKYFSPSFLVPGMIKTDKTKKSTATSDATGIVARDDSRQTITVAFRGTHSLRNWWANIQLVWKDASVFCSDCKLHRGFYDAFTEAFPPILASVTSLRAQYPSYKLVVTGHSFGGALATITATEFRRLGYSVDLYTYGAPRVGNDGFSRFVSRRSGNYRVTHLSITPPPSALV